MKGYGDQDCDYSKQNISLVILTLIYRNGQLSHDGDCKIFEVIDST